jgi:hypothetical protein
MRGVAIIVIQKRGARGSQKPPSRHLIREITKMPIGARKSTMFNVAAWLQSMIPLKDANNHT